MNFVGYLEENDVINYDNDKNQNKQKYFELCESCFWCASYIDFDDENKIHMTTTCPYCNDFKVKSLPLAIKT